ncbi:hypothetical protein PR202_gb06481 [Eleusine coracana subsp. coracana]|uniref:RIN4 pathogenic type III effector avirulence factor Avr cleavage site domain-containing protein n=1 Tax=Eleusine coracana subsp. coracana TaxID=191504 RepID=A0AAV5E8Z3_ELECO|nr:hypothetical protein PR202_gb06481 [Eleusine coracana subsp. coracana]
MLLHAYNILIHLNLAVKGQSVKGVWGALYSCANLDVPQRYLFELSLSFMSRASVFICFDFVQVKRKAQAAVPKFGSWDAENIGYTVFFEKVRDNKPAPPSAAPAAPKPPAPGGGGYDHFDPYEHYENLSRKVPSRPPSSHGGHHHSGHAPPAAPPKAAAPGVGYDYDPYDHYENISSRNVPSRPPSSHGYGHGHAAPAAAAPRSHGSGYDDYDPYEHYENLSSRNVPSRPPSSHGHGPAPAPQQPQHHHHRGGSGNGYHHRRTGSNGSMSAASETSSRASKFSPPRPYQPRYSNNNDHHYHQHQQGHGQYHHPQGAPSFDGYKPYASPSPPRGPPPQLRRPKPNNNKAPSAVPRFGVWDEQNAAMAAQGFTVQFEKVKRHREEAKAAAAPPVPPPQRDVSPDHYANAPAKHGYGKKKRNKSFLSKLYRCMFPVVRE